jgi:hypothetical protein
MVSLGLTYVENVSCNLWMKPASLMLVFNKYILVSELLESDVFASILPITIGILGAIESVVVLSSFLIVSTTSNISAFTNVLLK